MIVGTMSGIAPTWFTHSRPGYRPRTRLNASSVPSAVASTVVHAAILRLRPVAASQTGSFTYAAYQRNDHPGGGNCRYDAELNEIGNTMKSGSIRNRKTSPQNTFKARRPRERRGRRRSGDELCFIAG